MKLDEIVAWYQKKIGTYDKQEWEKTVEQRILDGFNNVNLKNTKLKTELIDVDLVRGSTFPKAKPKQSLLTVIRLAILRYLLLPLYAQWWVKQTSPNAFGFILVLYLTQLVNWAIYVLHSNSHTEPLVYDKPLNGTLLQTGTAGEDADKHEDHADLLSALLIPCALSLLISLIHSQIVATNTATGGTGGSSTKNKLRRFSMSSSIGDKSSVREHRLRRRKKFVSRTRQPEVEPNSSNISIPARRNANTSALEVPSRPVIIPSTTIISGVAQSDPILAATPSRSVVVKRSSSEETYITTTAISELHRLQATPSENGETKGFDLSRQTGGPTTASTATPESPKKRNVNWHTPIQIYATYERTEQPSSSQSIREEQIETIGDEEMRALKPSFQSRRNIGEDDGFESLNGKSSSGEDNNHSPLPNVAGIAVAPPVPVPSNQLRLRLNTGNSSSSNIAPPAEKLAQSRGNESTTSCAESDECDEADIISSPASTCNQECTTSATDWLGVTTNSEDCSYTSDIDHSDGGFKHAACSDEDPGELDITPTTILNPHSSLDRISCTIWDQRDAKKAQLSVLEIASCIIERVDSMGETNDYIYIGVVFSFLLTLIPTFCRLCEITLGSDAEKASEISYLYMPQLLWEKSSASLFNLLGFAFGEAQWERTVLALGFVQRLCLTLILFTIFAVAERTFKQRFLYAKLFSHLTSSRRARKSNLPHFRLNKVRNIKTWLSVRSYLKKRGPQRSVDIIVSAAFIVTLLLLAFLSVEWLKDSVHLHTHLTLEALIWSITIGIYLLRFMTLGQKIQHKYRSVSVLITEQINLYLQIEQKPKKKEELMVSNSVLKLAADLLKELETPFKISGLSANPYLFTTIKVVILSALSGVLSEVLGFKLKLHKIKIK
ncbi:putative homeodomain transcription factor isoform X1 [Drosophila serrata]|uniref:putative homeodomain transcription factor isoform X1 n=1 Tax=Drosophila serrata TaxID=7274 RepID=UPI000A1D165B|nr:putative homeodomain transcription factor isoform X1 [Drosophila serrata]XP_020815367.1 putative homeodomain transcription factor isoform X1 [Drosophila serrata]